MNRRATIRFEDWETEQLKDPEFRGVVEELEPAYQVTRLRIKRGLTQKQLADLVGTKQSCIARLEGGKSEPRLSFLRRVAKALRGRVNVRIVPEEERPAAEQPITVNINTYAFAGRATSGTVRFESSAGFAQHVITWNDPPRESIVQ